VSRRPAALVLLVLAIGTAIGCRSYRLLPNERWSEVAAGDDVRVTTRDGDVHRFRVASVTEDSLRGSDVGFRAAELRTVEVRRPVEGRKAFLVGGIALFVVVFIASGAWLL